MAEQRGILGITSRRPAGWLAGLLTLAILSAGCAQPAPSGSAGSAPASKAAAPSSASAPPASAPSAAQPSGAAPAASAPASQASAPTTPPTPVKVKMAYTALSGSFMPVWVAEDNGIFTQQGVDLDLSYIGNSPTAMAALLAGEVDLLVGAPDAGISAAIDSGDVVLVGSLLNKIVQAIYAAPAYREPNSLRGHSVGITRFGALSDSAVRYLLRRWNLEPERDVALRQIGGFPEMVAALSAGGIEAGILAPPHTLRAQDLGFVELGNLWTQPLEYPAIAFQARKQRTAEQDERARRVLRATVDGIHRVKNDRPAAIKTLESWAKSEDARANDEAYDIYTPLFERDLRISRDAMKTALEELVRSKPNAATFDPDLLMDGKFVDEIRTSGQLQRLYGS